MKADLGRLLRFNEQRRGNPELAIAYERGWRDFKTIKSFIYSENCRRSALLGHFGDGSGGDPTGRCCDVCDSATGLPDPKTIAVRRPSRASRGAPTPAELRADDAPLFDALKAWRLTTAAGKPAYTVAHNKTLAAIASSRPSGREALLAIGGVGPSFVAKYSDEVLALVAEHPAALADAA
jgi:superfamily II DNA helicase RecQ